MYAERTIYSYSDQQKNQQNLHLLIRFGELFVIHNQQQDVYNKLDITESIGKVPK